MAAAGQEVDHVAAPEQARSQLWHICLATGTLPPTQGHLHGRSFLHLVSS